MKSIMCMAFGCFVISSILGCVHTHRITSRVSDDQKYRAEIGKAEVSAGERLSVFVEKCKRNWDAHRRAPWCQREKVGEAEVIEVIDADNSVVRSLDGVSLEPAMLVEKR